MTINWSYPVTPNSTQMMLELYSASGSRIGLIAVSSNTSGSYTWHIPGFPQNYMCTLQYPNGLCGTNIPNGQYYLKVSATNDPFDSNPSIIASGQSGTFTMTGAGDSQGGITANPQSGAAPLTVTFSIPNYSGSYFVNFGDGLSASLVSGSVSHTYYNRGTYTASFTSDYACLHSTPACEIAQQNLGSVTVVAN
jgi:PKD repeat protein